MALATGNRWGYGYLWWVWDAGRPMPVSQTHRVRSAATRTWLVGVVLAGGALVSPVLAQPRPARAEACSAVGPADRQGRLRVAVSADQTASSAASPSGFKRFVWDVGGDYKRHFSRETAFWYGGGGATAGLVHLADEDVRDALADPSSATTQALEGGNYYGNVAVQMVAAAGWWVAGHVSGSARGADAGRDLLRAQISAASWTLAIKLVTNRTRPDGDPRSFPSGHAAATFATAMVLQEHYGWQVGVPFFGAATYTAVSRITDNRHWVSEVVFGAFVGAASARTVTLHLRKSRFVVTPLAVPGGAGMALMRLPDDRR